MILAAENLTVPGRLTSVSAELRPGQLTAICGPNGAGKTTLLRALAGLESASDLGLVTLGGTPLEAMPSRTRAQTIGYLPQQAAPAWNLTAEALVRLGRLPHRTARAEDDAAVHAALAALDATHLAPRGIHTLSGGERARVLLARVLAGQPRWVLADEPLASLDLAHAAALLAHFRGLADQGIGVVLVVHSLAHAMNHADRVIVLHRGHIAADASPQAALSEELIEHVWGVHAQWTGPTGARALSL
ncbi:ABC transporter ATP-binding protein [Novosphingobium sp.]|uniref:ABC transporter ATP-binding protein n=1 Tax=Novosphingobium sp. TaxID=1874826 RepID=UPI003BAD2964